MKEVSVSLNYAQSAAFSASSGVAAAPVVLPVRVLDSDGTLVAEGAASSSDVTKIGVPDGEDAMFVRLTWPSGRTEIQRVDTQGQVSFSDHEISRNEWSAWAATRIGHKPAADRESRASDPGIGKHAANWMRLWKFQAGTWVETPLELLESQQGSNAIQFDLRLEAANYCLQLGGARIPWILVALPGGGACRVLITPNASNDPRALPLKVVVTGFRTDAETLLEFLTRDSIHAARQVAKHAYVATRLVGSKVSDPIAAAAGALFLMRTRQWQNTAMWWFDNLAEGYPWLADGAIIRSAIQLRAGASSPHDVETAWHWFEVAVSRGVPVFAEGMSLLREISSILAVDANKKQQSLLAQVSQLVAAEAWAGAACAFFGEAPGKPSADRVYGTPGKSRAAGTGELTHFADLMAS